jgi:hypothetical protein
MHDRSRRLLIAALVSAAVASVPAWPAAAQSSNRDAEDQMLIGTWVLNLDKSHYASGKPPRRQTRTYEARGTDVRATVDTTTADGQTRHVEFVANYDSLEHPVTGSADADMIRMKKTAPRTSEATLSHAGKVSGVAKRVISADGRTLTITYDGETEGNQLHYIAVYDKK